MSPEFIYYALIAFVLFPAAAFARSGAALIIVTLWLIGQICQEVGGPTLIADTFCHAIGIVLIVGNATKFRVGLVGLIYALRMISDLMALSHRIEPFSYWWLDYWLAMMQVLFVVLSVNWQLFRANIANGVRGIRWPSIQQMAGLHG